jgi:GxxExxY protein
MELNDLSYKIIGLAIEIHKALGPGLLESCYEECLFLNSKLTAYIVEKQKALPLIYKDINIECGYRIDLLVENKIIAEVKSIESLNEVHLAQILTYLKLSKLNLGLLINFNVVNLTKGIKRVAN